MSCCAGQAAQPTFSDFFFGAFISWNEPSLQTQSLKYPRLEGCGFPTRSAPLATRAPPILLPVLLLVEENPEVFLAPSRQPHGTEEGKQVLPVQSTCTRAPGA